jgi:hypothetical protein
MGTVFSLFMIFLGSTYVYSGVIGTTDHRNDLLYSLTTGFMCLALASTVLFLSIKLYHHR